MGERKLNMLLTKVCASVWSRQRRDEAQRPPPGHLSHGANAQWGGSREATTFLFAKWVEYNRAGTYVPFSQFYPVATSM